MEEKIECPKCHTVAKHIFVKSWSMQGRVQGKRKTDANQKRFNIVKVFLYRCIKCGKNFHKGKSVKEEQK